MSSRRRMSSYRAWGSTEDGDIEFESLTEDTLEGALNVIRKSFFVDESVCRGVALAAEPGAPEELEELCLNAAKDGVSVVAIDVASGQVVGVAFNKIQLVNNSNEKSVFESFAEKCKCESSKALVNFMINVDSRLNLFDHYKVDCILEIMFLATLPGYYQRRIGELLVSSSLEMGKELKRGRSVKTPILINGDDRIQNFDALPNLVSAIMTSTYSQKIAKKLGFSELLNAAHDEFIFQGKTFAERIGKEHQSSILVAKRILT